MKEVVHSYRSGAGPFSGSYYAWHDTSSQTCFIAANVRKSYLKKKQSYILCDPGFQNLLEFGGYSDQFSPNSLRNRQNSATKFRFGESECWCSTEFFNTVVISSTDHICGTFMFVWASLDTTNRHLVDKLFPPTTIILHSSRSVSF
jgi:hypothetical protein